MVMVMVMVVYRGPGLPTLVPSTTTAPASLHVVVRGARLNLSVHVGCGCAQCESITPFPYLPAARFRLAAV